MSFRQVQLSDLPLWEQLIRSKKPKNSCITVIAFWLWGDDEWTCRYFHWQRWLQVCAVWAAESIFVHREIQSIQYNSLGRGGEWSSVYTEVLAGLGWNEQWNHVHLSRQVRGSVGLDWRAFSHKSKGMGCHIKAFLPATCLAQKETWLQTKCSYIILSEAYFLLLSFWQDNL